MTTTLVIIGIVAAVVVLGAYLRWAVRPVLTGYRAGVAVGQMLGAKYPVGSPATGGRKRHSDTGPQLAATGS